MPYTTRLLRPARNDDFNTTRNDGRRFAMTRNFPFHAMTSDTPLHAMTRNFPSHARTHNASHLAMAKKIIHCTLLIAHCSLFFSCAQFFQDKVPKNPDGANAHLSDIVTDKEVITQLPAPSQIVVSEYYSPENIFVTWSKVDGASYYRLERAVAKTANSDGSFSVPDESEFEVLDKYVYGTSYVDEVVSNPTYKSDEYGYGYFYRVSAENPRKSYDASDFSFSGAGTLFAPVKAVSATQGEDSSYIKVTWEKTENASAYRIYRSAYSDGSGASLLTTVPANQDWYTNTVDSAAQGVEFYYSVYAVNSEKYTSPVSPIALGYSLVEGAPSRVSNVRITEGRGDSTDSISIEWDAVSGSGVEYLVYRTSSVDSASMLLTSKGIKETKHTDSKSLSPNVYYYYQVLAYTIDDEGNRLKGPISQSSASDKNPCEGFILSPPYSLSVVYASENGKCTLTFPAALGSSDCPKDSGLTTNYNSYSYKIYSCDTQTGSFVDTGDAFDANALTASGGYYSVTVGSAKFYKVSTVFGEIESAQSSVAAPSPYAAKNLEATKRAYIDGVTVSGKENDNEVYPVKITWEEPEGGADGGYYLYRSTKPDSGYRKVEDNPITATEYVDSYDAAKPGTIYYYRVLSLNELKQGANYSNVGEGWGALTQRRYMHEYNKTILASHKKLTLMNKSGSTEKLGSETVTADLGGTCYYNAKLDGLGARIIMRYDNYAEFWANGDESKGYYFRVTGNTNTSASMDASGTMDGTVTCEGMYPGTVVYDQIKIKGGDAGGGYYIVTPEGFGSGNVAWNNIAQSPN